MSFLKFMQPIAMSDRLSNAVQVDPNIQDLRKANLYNPFHGERAERSAYQHGTFPLRQLQS
jgi:hypothetical protein